jgi:hypothetical protein
MIDPLEDHAFEKHVPSANVDAKSNFIELSDGNEPVPDPD